MGRTKVERPRNPERGFLIDIESDGALKKMGFDDPGLAKKVLNEIRRGREVWGLQAIEIAPIEEMDENSEDSREMENAERLGKIDGWPLNPHRYRPDGSVIDGGPEEGIHNGLDYRGMVPGGITGARVSRVPEPMPADIPIHLNIP